MADNRKKAAKPRPPAAVFDPAALEAVRLEVARWMEYVRSHVGAMWASAAELRDEVRDNPGGLVGQVFAGNADALNDIVRGLEEADSAASYSKLPPTRPVPDPLGVAARAAGEGGRRGAPG